MTALSFFSKDSYSFVFDVGSASIGVALVRHEKDRPREIIFTHREPIQLKTKTDVANSLGTQIGEAIKKAGGVALEKFSKINGIKDSYSVHVLVHAPWANSQTHHAEGTVPEEAVLSKKVLQKFISENIPILDTSNSRQFDRHVTKIALNGYPTAKPYGKKFTHISIIVLESAMSNTLYTSMNQAFKEIFPNNSVHMDAFLFAATELTKKSDAFESYTLVDISGEYASISVVQDGSLAGSTWAQFGSEYLIRALATSDEASRQSIISELSMFMNNTCTPSQCRKVENALQDTEKQLVRSFGDACAQLYKHCKITPRAYVFIDKKYAPWFKKLIERIDFAHFTVTGTPFEVTLVTTDSLSKPIRYREGSRRDALLALGASICVDK